MLDLSTLTIEDVTGRLWTVDEHLEQATATKDSDKLLLIKEKWVARRNSGVASSSSGGDGKRRGSDFVGVLRVDAEASVPLEADKRGDL